MKKLFLLFSCCLPICANSANWVQYATEGNDSTFSYDSSSVKIKTLSNGTKYIQAWEKGIFDTAQYGKKYSTDCNGYRDSYCNQPYYSTKSLISYNCWNDKYTLSKFISYTQNGNVVESNDFNINERSSYNWTITIPDTIGEGAMKEICYAYKNRLK